MSVFLSFCSALCIHVDSLKVIQTGNVGLPIKDYISIEKSNGRTATGMFSHESF